MLDAQLLDEAGWEDSGRESASEDGGELGVESTDSHVFELEIRRQDRVGGRPGERNKSGYPVPDAGYGLSHTFSHPT